MYSIIIPSSNLPELAFPFKSLYNKFKKEEKELYIKYRILLEKKYGYWAPDQNMYVKKKENLNAMDIELRELGC